MRIYITLHCAYICIWECVFAISSVRTTMNWLYWKSNKNANFSTLFYIWKITLSLNCGFMSFDGNFKLYIRFPQKVWGNYNKMTSYKVNIIKVLACYLPTWVSTAALLICLSISIRRFVMNWICFRTIQLELQRLMIVLRLRNNKGFVCNLLDLAGMSAIYLSQKI